MPKPIENILAPSFVKRSGLWAVAVKNNAVATLTDLRALDGEALYEPAHVPTLNGGLFIWDNDTATPHDGVLCIAKASSRTGSWKRVYSGDIAPEWFDVWDDDDAYPAIQAALDYTRPIDGATYISKRVRLSNRAYPVSRPPAVYSGSQFVGEGPASKLVARSDFIGSGLLTAGTASATTTTQLSSFTIENIGFDPGELDNADDLWAIDLSNIATVLHGRISIWHWTACGVNLSSYTQHTIVDQIWSYGNCNRLLWLKGNHNEFGHINKEGPTGTSADPYILVEDHAEGASQSNYFHHVLIEGALSTNKVGFEANSTVELTINDLWVEGVTSGYALVLDDCKNFLLKGSQTHLTSDSKWRVQNGSFGKVEIVDTAAEAVAWSDLFSIDETSSVECPQVYSRSSANPRAIDSGSLVHVDAHVSQTLLETPVLGVSPVSRARYATPANQAKNGSFEAGNYQWGGWGGGAYNATQSFPVTEVGPPGSLMCQFDTFTGPSQGIVQSRSISAAQAGHPLTMAALVKISGNGFVFAHFDGAGTTLAYLQQVFDDGKWHLISATVMPTAAGTLEFGVAWRSVDASTVIKLDMYSLIPGDEGVPMHDSYQQVERGGNTILYGVTAAPGTGTWKVGDQAWRSNPSSGNPPGWVCTAAPITWTAMANLA